jgi:hypothetical protein
MRSFCLIVFHQDSRLPIRFAFRFITFETRARHRHNCRAGRRSSDELFAGYDWFRTYLEIEDRFGDTRSRRPSPRVALRQRGATFRAKVLKRLASELVRRLGANESLFWGGAIVFDKP